MTEQELAVYLEAAEKSPDALARAVAGLDNATLGYKPLPDKWSILEILAHLADADIILGYRIRQVMGDKDPTFAPIDQDEWARHLGYQETEPADLLELYRVNRRANVRLLRRATADDLAKSGFHPESAGLASRSLWSVSRYTGPATSRKSSG